jgi:excisionase family DNA binding protein
MPPTTTRQLRKHKPASGLPAALPGEPFSLIGTLRRTTSMLTVEDVAQILQCSNRVVYKWIDAGKIPVADVGFDLLRVDPKAWSVLLEQNNKHLAAGLRPRRVA